MTVSSETRVSGPYSGDGSTSEFAFAFKVFDEDEVKVVQTDADGVESTLAQDTDYSVSLNDDQDDDPGGTVTLVTAPGSDELLTLTSDLAYTQTLDLTNLGGFYPTTINDALDRLAIQIQQVEEVASRAITVDISSSEDATDLLDDLQNGATYAQKYASAASASATAAASSEANAATSETNAAASATAAAASATSIADSETNAAASASSAQTAQAIAIARALEAIRSAYRADQAALAATSPIAAVVLSYLDTYIWNDIEYSDFQTVLDNESDEWDMGDLSDSAVFANENRPERYISLSLDGTSIDLGGLS